MTNIRKFKERFPAVESEFGFSLIFTYTHVLILYRLLLSCDWLKKYQVTPSYENEFGFFLIFTCTQVLIAYRVFLLLCDWFKSQATTKIREWTKKIYKLLL